MMRRSVGATLGFECAAISNLQLLSLLSSGILVNMRIFLLVFLVGCGSANDAQPAKMTADPPEASADTGATADGGPESGLSVKGDSGTEAEAAIALDSGADSWVDPPEASADAADANASAADADPCDAGGADASAPPSWCGCVAAPNDPTCMYGAPCRWVRETWMAPVCQNECGLVRCR